MPSPQPYAMMDEQRSMLARALHEAGQTDTEIGLAVGMPAANIADWRRRNDIAENKPPMSDEMRRYMEQARPGGRDEDEDEDDAPVAASAPPQRSFTPPPVVRPPSAGAPPVARPVAAVSRPAPAPRPVAAPVLSGVGVQPEGDNALNIGNNPDDQPVYVDLQETLITRLLIQGNSGSGKSHLLRRLIEESTGVIQQIIIDPEGDFVSLGETFGHMVIDATAYSPRQLATIGGRVRATRVSAVVNLNGLELEQQMIRATSFLDALFNAPTTDWHPALVFVDEAQVFAPNHSAQIDVDSEVRAGCVKAMADLMCRGRKRGLGGIIATQRLAKLHSNVSGEVSNFLMGRTFYNVDMDRAADLLGMRKSDSGIFSDLERGEFIGIGPAIARRALKAAVGPTITVSPHAAPEITPLPSLSTMDLAGLLDVPEDEPEGQAEAPVAPAARKLRVVGDGA